MKPAVFYLERKSREQIIPKIGNAAVFNRSRIQDVGDTRSDYEQLDDAIESVLFMKAQINREGEDFYYINTLMSVSADNVDDLKRREKETVNLCSSLGFTARRADYMQDKALLSLLLFMEKFTELKSVTMALKRLVEGSASGLGGQTNIDLSSPFIVLDTSRLSKEFTALGTFIATEFVKDRISLSRVKKKAVILDEAVKLKEKLMLTESETMQIIRCGRGEGLLCAGRNRIAIDIRASDTEFELITTDRESLEKRVKAE